MENNNILNKILNLKLSMKILLVIVYFMLSFLFIFLKSNYYNIKNRVNGIYHIYSNVKKDGIDNYTVYRIKFDTTNVKRLFIKYNSEESFDFELKYSLVNNDVVYEKEDKDECSEYSTLNVYDIKDIVNTLTITVPEDVVIEDVYINNNYTFDYFSFILSIIVFIISIGLSYVYKKGYDKIYILFYLMYVSFGVFIVISTPPTTGACWDDQIHFRNTIQTIFFDNYEKTSAEDLSIDLKSKFYFFDHLEEQNDFINNIDLIDKNVQIEKNNQNIITYTSLAYLPGSVVYNLLKIFGISFSVRYNTVRIIGIVIYALIFSYAIKIAKKYKLLMFVMGLIPEGLFIASNYNYDAFIFAFSILGFASFINMLDSDKLKTKDVITFVVSITLATLTKVIYGPLFLLLLLLPNEKFSSIKNAKIVKKYIIFITALVMSTFVIPVLFSNVGMNDNRGGSNVSMALQLKYIIHNPISSSMLLLKNIVDHYFSYTISSQSLLFFAYRGGVSSEAYVFMIFIFVLAFLQSCEEKNNIKIFSKFFIELIVFIIISATWGILYLTFNNVGSSEISGVQPRYFMPLIIFMIFPFITNKITYKIDKKTTTLIVTILYFIVYMILFCEKYFYYL